MIALLCIFGALAVLAVIGAVVLLIMEDHL